MANLDPVIAYILLGWLVFFGASIGSFLNVVVYRMPLGKNLSDPPSHCPKCGYPIRWYDNVPVLGWLWLGGKCRDCQEPISIRYPIVEFIGGSVFGVIAWLTIRRGGDASLSEFFFFVLGLSSLVLTFFAAGLIQRDSKPVPWRLFLPIIIMGFMMPWLVQESLHIAAFGSPMPLQEELTIESDGVFLVIIWFCLPATFLFSWGFTWNRWIAWMTGGVLVGVYLGWGGVGVIVVAGTLQILFRLTPLRKTVTPMLVLAVTTFVMIVLILGSAPPFQTFIPSPAILPVPD